MLVDPERRYCRVVAGAVGAKPVSLPEAARSLAATAAPPESDALLAEIAGCTGEHDPVKLHMAAVAVQRAVGRSLEAP